MKNFFVGFVGALSLILLGAYIFIISGGMPVGTKGKPLPLERFIAKKALHAAIKNEEDLPSPIDGNDGNLAWGAKVYVVQCAICHGVPGRGPSFIAKGLFPKPPQLFPPHKGVTDDLVGETYWKVKNGIRLTGMPGFEESLSDKELWQVSELLLNADKLPPQVLEILTPKNK
jgi:thiosulfate dehydrogenase